MKVKNKKTYFLCKKTTVKDDTGKVKICYLEPVKIMANIYPASGKVQAELYGDRLNYILNMLIDMEIEIKENDGVCVNTTDVPDYKVISIKQYTNHRFMELEKL